MNLVLHLQETYSLSVLTYAIPAPKLTTRQVDELNACWNSAIRRLFRFNKWESVSAVLLGLGKLNVKHLIMLRKVNLYRRLLNSCDRFLCDVFFIFLSGNVLMARCLCLFFVPSLMLLIMCGCLL